MNSVNMTMSEQIIIIVRNQSDSRILFGAQDPTYQLIPREWNYMQLPSSYTCCNVMIFRTLICAVHKPTYEIRPCEVVTYNRLRRKVMHVMICILDNSS